MSRRFFEQMMLDELELTNFANYQRWLASQNPVFFGLPDPDFRRTARMNRFDFCPVDYCQQPYWMPQSFVFPGYEPFCFVRRNDKRGFQAKNFQHPKDKRNFGEKRGFLNRSEDIRLRSDRGKGSDFLPHFERRYQPHWAREAHLQHYQIQREDRNSSQASYKLSTIDLNAEDVLDQHMKNLEQMFESKNPSTECFLPKEHRTNNGVSENGIQSMDAQYCKPPEHDWKDQTSKTSKTQNADGKSYSSSDFSNSYEFWYCPEEQQQIVDMLKEVNLRHDRQLHRDMIIARGEHQCSDESVSSGNNSHTENLPKHSTSSSDDEDDGITILLSPRGVPPIPEEINEEEAKLKESYLEKSATDIFEEFQNILTGSPEKKIINNLTKESLKKQDVLHDDDINSLRRVITNEDKDAVKSCLKFESLEDICDELLAGISGVPASSPKESSHKNICTENTVPESSNNPEISKCDTKNSETKLESRDFISSSHNNILFNSDKMSKVVTENKSSTDSEESSVSMEVDNTSPDIPLDVHLPKDYPAITDNVKEASNPVNKEAPPPDTQECKKGNYHGLSLSDIESKVVSKTTHYSKNGKTLKEKSQASLQSHAMNQSSSEKNKYACCPESITQKPEKQVEGTETSNKARQCRINGSKISSHLPDGHSQSYDSGHSQGDHLSTSELFLPRDTNETVYKRISMSEIFKSVDENSSKNFEELQTEQNHVRNYLSSPISLISLSPSDYLKHILGIGKENNCPGNNGTVQKNINSKNTKSPNICQNHQQTSKFSESSGSLTTEKCHYSFPESKTTVSAQNACCMTAVNQETKNETFKENQSCGIYSNNEIRPNDFEKCKSPGRSDKAPRRRKYLENSTQRLNNSSASSNYSKITNNDASSNSKLTEAHSANVSANQRNETRKTNEVQDKLPINENMNDYTDSKDTSRECKMSQNSECSKENNLNNITGINLVKEDCSEECLRCTEKNSLLINGLNATIKGAALNGKRETKLSCTLLNRRTEFSKTKKKFKKKKKKEKTFEECTDKNVIFVTEKRVDSREYLKENNNTDGNFDCSGKDECKSSLAKVKKERSNVKYEDKVIRGDAIHSTSKLTVKNTAQSNHSSAKNLHNKEIGSQKKQKCDINSTTCERGSTNLLNGKGAEFPVKSKVFNEERKVSYSNSWSRCNFSSKCEFGKKESENLEKTRYWKDGFRKVNQKDSQGEDTYIKRKPSRDIQWDKRLKGNVSVGARRPSENCCKVGSSEFSKCLPIKNYHGESSSANEKRKDKDIQNTVKDHEASFKTVHAEKEIPSTVHDPSTSKVNVQQPAIKDSTEWCGNNKRAKTNIKNMGNRMCNNTISKISKLSRRELLKSMYIKSCFMRLISDLRYQMELLQEAEKNPSAEKRKSSAFSTGESRPKIKEGWQSASSSISSGRNITISKFSGKPNLTYAACNHTERNEEQSCGHDSKITGDNVTACALKPFDGNGKAKCLQKYICNSEVELQKNTRAESQDSVHFDQNILVINYLIQRMKTNKSEKIAILIPPGATLNFLQGGQALLSASKLNPLPEIPLEVQLHSIFSQFNNVRFSARLQNCLQLFLSALVSQNLLQSVPSLLRALSMLYDLNIPWSRNNLKELLDLEHSKKAKSVEEKELKSLKKETNEGNVRDVLKCWDILSCYISEMKDENAVYPFKNPFLNI